MPASRSASVQGDPSSPPSPSRSKSSRASSYRNLPRQSPSPSGLQLVLASAPPSNTPSTMHYISIGTLYDAGLVPMTILCFRNGRMYSVPIESLPARLDHRLDGFSAPSHNPDVIYTGVDIDSFVHQSSPLPGAASPAPSLSLIGHQPDTVFIGGRCSEVKTGATAVTDSGPSVAAASIPPAAAAAAPLTPAIAAASISPPPAAAPADDDDGDGDHDDDNYGGGGSTLPALPPAFGPMGHLPPLPPFFLTPGLSFGPTGLAGSQQASTLSQPAANGSSQQAGPTGIAKSGQRYVNGVWQADPRANRASPVAKRGHLVYPEGIPSHPPWLPPVKLLVTKLGVTAYDLQEADIPCIQCKQWHMHAKMQGHIKSTHGESVRCRICNAMVGDGRKEWTRHYVCLTEWNIRVGRDFYAKDLFESRGSVNS